MATNFGDKLATTLSFSAVSFRKSLKYRKLHYVKFDEVWYTVIPEITRVEVNFRAI